MNLIVKINQFVQPIVDLIPSGLYAAYNIIGFYSLSLSDPPTYFILLQMRSLVIGLVYQLFFKQNLSRTQWASLCILTVGTSTKQFSFESGFHVQFNAAVPLILIQIVCSCFASVYNEYLLKHREVDFWVQNIFFYLNSIIINTAVFIAMADYDKSQFAAVFRFPVMLIAVNLSGNYISRLDMFCETSGSILELILC